MDKPILEVKELKTHFLTDNGSVPAVDGIDFHLNDGEVLGIVGESGSGKSVTSLSIMQLVGQPGKIVDGEILFDGEDLVKASEKRMRQVRGGKIGMIFQEPMTSLNPVYKIGNQLVEALRIHKKMSKDAARKRAIEIMKLVGLPRAEDLMNDYPHQLSGGMRQRVMIAMAMICEPKILIADEPTTALDVTIQAQILDLMKKLNHELNTSIIMITHDLGVVSEVCDRIAVMYAGRIVEEGETKSLLRNPQHPYTKGLVESIPDVRYKKERLYSIPGNVPTPGSVKKGCPFAARCAFAFDKCSEDSPILIDLGDNHRVRCLLHEEENGAELLQTSMK
ncbi:ABC transporter ATP-binding protein [Ornithinibacillus californiensis]|uniref:ABC transporter ATP-binding protein n=1 Tax=Ornithinibacillus californiensis TaxID=161536 RepID=UPI00064DB5A9|nr:ABC transporter ATP-binding protein [Ornithinibacillus californiensis]